MALESDAVPEDCRSAVIVPLHKGKGYYLVKYGWKNICRDPSRQNS